MNLKYYLRGLGIGIVVTAIIMSISTNDKKEKLSDAEIKARAAELGMVEESSGLLSELEKTEEAQVTEIPEMTEEAEATVAPEIKEEAEATVVPEIKEEVEATVAPEIKEEAEATVTPEMAERLTVAEETEVEATPEPTKTPKPTVAPLKEPVSETITIQINQGESSYMVCKRLEENNLIASAADFDIYLCDRGLDKRLKAGIYEIPQDAEPEKIAQILTF